MAKLKRAFISYRRDDEFEEFQHPPTKEIFESNKRYPIKLQKKLKCLGFDNVFLDQEVIRSGQGWLDKIFDGISGSDAFFLLIGHKWSQLMEDKSKQDQHDILLEEIRLALSHERTIIPVVVEGAKLPNESILPADIRYILEINAVFLKNLDDSVEFEKKFESTFDIIEKQNCLGDNWKFYYAAATAVVWFLTAGLPNVIGMHEFGPTVWSRLALIWGGLFVWPIVFVPFAMIGFYRPITHLAEQIASAAVPERRLRYYAPFLGALCLGAVGAGMDVITGEVVWTVKPAKGKVCGDPPGQTSQESGNTNLLFFTYGSNPQNYLADLYLEKYHYKPFWLRDDNRCWPSVFFYLTDPMMTEIRNNKYYQEERSPIVDKYRRMIKYDAEMKTEFVRTNLFFSYVFSMFSLITLMAMGVIFSVYYTVFGVDDPRDGLRKLKLPVEAAYLGLLYAFITLLMWHPFRILTNYFKYLACSGAGAGKTCEFDVEFLFNDSFLFFFVVIGYVFITIGLFVDQKEKRVIWVSFVTIFSSVIFMFIAYWFREEIPNVIHQFYLSVIVLALLILLFAWLIIDPGKIRKEKFKEKF